MFDSVMVECPACGEKKVEFQSKAGACVCDFFFEECVPAIIAADLHGDTETCPKCGTTLTIFAELASHVQVKAVRLPQED